MAEIDVPEKVMIIEDNRLHMRLYADVLRAHGYHPVEISDGRRAIQASLNSSPIAVIADVLLPSIDGRKIIAEMRRNSATEKTPILAISAAADPDIAESCLDAGADRFYAKPVSLRAIMADIEKLTGKSAPN